MGRATDARRQWRGTRVALLVVLGSQVVLQVLAPQLRAPGGAADVGDLVLLPVVLAAAAFWYFQWRLTGSSLTAWLSAAVGSVGVHELTVTALMLATGEDLTGHPRWTLAVDLLLILGVLAVLLVAERWRLPVDPAAAAGACGLTVALAHLAVAAQAPRMAMPPWMLLAGAGALMAGAVLVGAAVLRLETLPERLRWQLWGATVGLGFQRAVNYPQMDGALPGLLAAAVGVVCAVLLCATAAEMLRAAIVSDRSRVDALTGRLQELERSARADRERMHELRGSIAGLAAASHLVADEQLPVNRRLVLHGMLEAETGRLQRLLAGECPADPVTEGVVDLDEVIGPLVVRHQARAGPVRWSGNGARIWGHADDVALVLSILLENAARHAPGAPVSVGVEQGDEEVRLVVTDSGPGISREVRERLFDWGSAGPGSAGEGIGLHVARRVMGNGRCSITVSEPPGGGTSFVVGLRPASPGTRHAPVSSASG